MGTPRQLEGDCPLGGTQLGGARNLYGGSGPVHQKGLD